MSTSNEVDGSFEDTQSECIPDGFSTLFPLSALAVLRLAEIEQRVYDLERVQDVQDTTDANSCDEIATSQNRGPYDEGIWQFGSPERREELRALLLAAHTGYDNHSSSSSERSLGVRGKDEKCSPEA